MPRTIASLMFLLIVINIIVLLTVFLRNLKNIYTKEYPTFDSLSLSTLALLKITRKLYNFVVISSGLFIFVICLTLIPLNYTFGVIGMIIFICLALHAKYPDTIESGKKHIIFSCLGFFVLAILVIYTNTIFGNVYALICMLIYCITSILHAITRLKSKRGVIVEESLFLIMLLLFFFGSYFYLPV